MQLHRLVTVGALLLHSLADQMPFLALVASFHFLLALEQDGVVLFFDDDEVGLETAASNS